MLPVMLIWPLASAAPAERPSLSDAEKAQGVRIFIGSENKLFSLSGSSVILSPYKDANDKVVGVLGVIGPTRLNYARIVPVVDYTAQVVSAMMARKK